MTIVTGHSDLDCTLALYNMDHQEEGDRTKGVGVTRYWF